MYPAIFMAIVKAPAFLKPIVKAYTRWFYMPIVKGYFYIYRRFLNAIVIGIFLGNMPARAGPGCPRRGTHCTMTCRACQVVQLVALPHQSAQSGVSSSMSSPGYLSVIALSPNRVEPYQWWRRRTAAPWSDARMSRQQCRWIPCQTRTWPAQSWWVLSCAPYV